MLAGHYRNSLVIPRDTRLHVNEAEENQAIRRETLFEAPFEALTSSQHFEVDVSAFRLRIDNLEYAFAANKKNGIHEGEYRVVEKWEQPYWRKNGDLWLPGSRNPIGEYLIILGDKNTEKKITTSIHRWPAWRYEQHAFEAGPFSEGCLRIRKEEMRELFERTELGAKVTIHH